MAEEKKKFDFVAPFKDIPAALKGIPKGWLKMVRDNIKTPQQLEEVVPQVWAYTYLGVLFCVACGLLGLIPVVGGIFMILCVVGFVFTVVTAWKFLAIRSAKLRFSMLTCSECQTLLDIDTPEEVAQYVSYQINSNKLKLVTSRGTLKDGIYESVSVEGRNEVEVTITMKCPHCGATKTVQFCYIPFRCRLYEKNISQSNAPLVENMLVERVNAFLDVYKKNPESIPYSTHSVHHPEYNASQWNSSTFTHNGFTIVYHRTVQEMVEGFFIRGEIVGKLVK